MNENTAIHTHLTVRELHDLISPLRDDMPVYVHVGWDWPVPATDVDDDGLILFADTPDEVSFVNMEGLESMHKSDVKAWREVHQLRKIAELADIYMSNAAPESRVPLGKALAAWRRG